MHGLYTATNAFSRRKCPIFIDFFPLMCEIKLSLGICIKFSFETNRNMTTNMSAKFDKYWEIDHGIVWIANVLVLRYKLKLLEISFLISLKTCLIMKFKGLQTIVMICCINLKALLRLARLPCYPNLMAQRWTPLSISTSLMVMISMWVIQIKIYWKYIRVRSLFGGESFGKNFGLWHFSLVEKLWTLLPNIANDC